MKLLLCSFILDDIFQITYIFFFNLCIMEHIEWLLIPLVIALSAVKPKYLPRGTLDGGATCEVRELRNCPCDLWAELAGL